TGVNTNKYCGNYIRYRLETLGASVPNDDEMTDTFTGWQDLLSENTVSSSDTYSNPSVPFPSALSTAINTARNLGVNNTNVGLINSAKAGTLMQTSYGCGAQF